jgi:prevent-host-death family protein
MSKVQDSGQPLIITKRGVPIVMVIPYEEKEKKQALARILECMLVTRDEKILEYGSKMRVHTLKI